MDGRYNLVLLLTLTSYAFWCTTAKASVVGTEPNVIGWKGEDIRLPCDFQEDPFAVYWVKETISGQKEDKAGFSDGNFESYEERFNIDRNFSLVITELEVADEGLYFCQVALGDLQIFENSTLMTVNSMASRHVIEECVHESPTTQDQCTYQTLSNTPFINLTCVVSGFKPNVSMLWTEESGQILNSTVSRQTSLSDDTYERSETIDVSAKQGTEQTFMCTAIGDALNGTSTMGIIVLPIPERRHNVGVIIGIAVGLFVIVLFLIIGLFLQKYHPDYVRKVCDWTTCWRLHKTMEYDVEGIMMGLPPSHLPLTREEVLQCKQDLKAFYRRTRRKVTVDPLNLMERANLDEIYTNLSLKESGDMRETPITYEDLLTNDKSGILSERILIQGEAGVGKTSLCSKIAWDWCHGRILQDLDMVIVIPLRDVTVDKTIGAIVERYLSDSNEATAQQLDKYIAANLSKILLVLDGFDEFNEKIEESSRSEVIRILGLEQYKTCRVIVTTRQWRSHELTMVKSLSKAYNCITIAGFSQQNLLNYISRYFLIRENDARRKSLISFMEESDVIRSYMVPFPIYCAMLCLMWKEFSEERRKELEKMQTFSEIFGEMICFLKEHYASKLCDNIQNQKIVEDIQEAGRAIQAIGEIALLGLLERKFSFSQEQFKNYQDAFETCCKVGVLTNEKDIINRKRRRDANIQSVVVSTVSFPHKLFQDYIAGVHIEFLFASDHAEYHKVKDKLLSQYEEFRHLLYFASAFRKEVGFDIIDGLIKKDDQNFCLDVAFECHTEEASKVVGERWKAYELSRSMSDHTKSGVVFLLHCNQVKSLHIDDGHYGKTISRYLAEGMCTSSELRKATILGTRLHSEFYRIVGEKASKCCIQELNVSLVSLADDAQQPTMENLTRWVCTMPNLSHFYLTCPYFPDSFFKCAADLSSSCQIQDLTLIIGDWKQKFTYQQSSAGKHLAEWVCSMPRLSAFSLECSYLFDDFFSTAADMAQTCQIRELSLSTFTDSTSKPAAAENFAKFLCQMPQLARADLKCRTLPREFLQTVASQTTSSKQEMITINGVAVSTLIGQ
ncbi:uncharacterized protein [Diadema antillarum]|uniref:uncharacterized protein n=1 Tax=Diadema antillarum TaxID=105358 RepID=UPI003A8B76DA